MTAPAAFDHATSHHPFTLPVTLIRGQNSLEFIRAVFDCYEKSQIFAIMKPGADLPFSNDDGPVLDLSAAQATTGWCRLSHQPDTTDTPAQITLTSGTEGAPKPILLSHRNLADVVVRLNDVMKVTPDIREYIGIPVQYSFGLGRVRAVSAAGGAFYLPRTFDPAEIRRMLDADEINAVSAVPSLWRLVLGAPDIIGDAGHKLRWIEIGSQYMSSDEKAAMKQLFPQARIVQHYGMTEASRTTFLVVSDVDPRYLDTVGTPSGSAEVAVADTGAIQIRGPHVAMGLITPDRTIKPLTNADGWLQTGDRGEMQDGYLTYKGRIDDQINIAGVKINAEAIEAEITALMPSAGGQFAIVSSPDTLRGEIALLVIEAGADRIAPILLAAAAQAFENRGMPAAGALRSTRVTALPRTDTGKIARVKLRDTPPPTDSDKPDTAPSRLLTAAETAVADTWCRVVGDMQIGPDDTFYDIGGDSLSALQIALTMERKNFNQSAIRATFEGRTLADVAQANTADITAARPQKATPLADQTQRTWALTLARALAVLAVLLSHWGEGFFARLGIGTLTDQYLPVLYRLGTPGFATVFGIGVGLTMLPQFATHRTSVLRRCRNAFFLVGFGICILAIKSITLILLNGGSLSGLMLANAFYGVLMFYAVMLGTAPVWMPALARMSTPVQTLPLLAVGLWLLWPVAQRIMPMGQLESFLELPRLMAIAGYSLFKLGAVMLVGIAIGLWIANEADTAQVKRRLLTIGVAGMAFCATTIVSLEGAAAVMTRFSAVFSSLPGYGFYASTMIAVMGLALGVTAVWHRLSGPALFGLRVLVVIGGLALPIYVFHGLVIPLKDILVILGIPSALALILPLTAFLATITYAGRRLYGMYFD